MCSLLQSDDSHVLSYSECKIAKMFRGFAPGPHWGGLIAAPGPQAAQWFFVFRKTGSPKKIAGYGTDTVASIDKVFISKDCDGF